MKNILYKIAAVLAAGFMFGACEDDRGNAIPDRTEYVTSGSMLKMYNHAEGSPQVNFYLGNEKVSAAAPVASAPTIIRGLPFGSTYPSRYGYASVKSGDFTLSVIDTITSETKGTAIELANRSVKLEEGATQSAFLVGTAGNYELMVTKDVLPPVSFNKIYFRFMQTLANAPYNFDVWAVRQKVAATATAPEIPEQRIQIASNIAFKEVGEYVEVPRGSYRIEFYKAGSTALEDLYTAYPTSSATAAITTLSLGRVYTIFLRGTWSSPAKTSHIDYWRER